MKMCNLVPLKCFFFTFKGVNLIVRLLMLWLRSIICDLCESKHLPRQSQSIVQACNFVRNRDLYISQFRKLISYWIMLVFQAPFLECVYKLFGYKRFTKCNERKLALLNTRTRVMQAPRYDLPVRKQRFRVLKKDVFMRDGKCNKHPSKSSSELEKFNAATK